MKFRNQVVRYRAGALLVCAVAVMGQAGVGQTKDSAAAPPALPAVTVTGFVDTYFEYNFDRPKTHINELRNFDVTDEQFILSSRAARPDRWPTFARRTSPSSPRSDRD